MQNAAPNSLREKKHKKHKDKAHDQHPVGGEASDYILEVEHDGSANKGSKKCAHAP